MPFLFIFLSLAHRLADRSPKGRNFAFWQNRPGSNPFTAFIKQKKNTTPFSAVLSFGWGIGIFSAATPPSRFACPRACRPFPERSAFGYAKPPWFESLYCFYKTKKNTTPFSAVFSFGWGIGIRTPTNRVREYAFLLRGLLCLF